MHEHRYLEQAAALVEHYEGRVPLALYLKTHFNTFRKAGSRDRKAITELVYAYFRLGRGLQDRNVRERIRAGVFLSDTAGSLLREALVPEWAGAWSPDPTQRLGFLNTQGWAVSPGDLFGWKDHLSEGVEAKAFSLSMLRQPWRFIRLRPGSEARVLERLEQSGVAFHRVEPSALGFPQALDLEQLLGPETDYVVQDLSSQRCARYFPGLEPQGRYGVWDACAASGGKTLLFHDCYPESRFLETDIRPSILANLRKRLRTAGLSGVQDAVLDLTDPQAVTRCLGRRSFDVILADLPCSGSGTWARSPEQQLYFTAEQLEACCRRQRAILQQLTGYLKPGGYLLYMTCSVFREENEQQLAFLQEEGLLLEDSGVLAGYRQAADTLFAGRLRQP